MKVIILFLLLNIQEIDKKEIIKKLEKIEKIAYSLPSPKKDSINILIQEIKNILYPEELKGELTENELSNIIEEINKNPVVEDALKILEKKTKNRNLTVNQAKKILNEFHFKEDKIKVFNILKEKIIDKENLKTLEREIK
ncbi:MAG: DUF4476 domain-containing protein [candidate division WOR-3 bacterium]